MAASGSFRREMWCARKEAAALLAVMAMVGPLWADVKTKVIQEAAEAMMARYGSRAVGRSLPSLMQKMESFVARYGEEGLVAIRRAGPAAFAAVEEAGVQNGPRAVKLLAQFGEEGATCVLRRPKAMQQFLVLGEDAAAALVRHPGIAEKVIERGGASAVRAMGNVSAQNGRRIAMVMDGEVGKLARSHELLDVVGMYGDRAASFIWANKGTLAVGTGLTAFLAKPEAFINGATELTGIAAKTVAQPIVEGVAKGTNWTLIVFAVVAACAGIVAAKMGLLHRKPNAEGVSAPAAGGAS